MGDVGVLMISLALSLWWPLICNVSLLGVCERYVLASTWFVRRGMLMYIQVPMAWSSV